MVAVPITFKRMVAVPITFLFLLPSKYKRMVAVPITLSLLPSKEWWLSLLPFFSLEEGSNDP